MVINIKLTFQLYYNVINNTINPHGALEGHHITTIIIIIIIIIYYYCYYYYYYYYCHLYNHPHGALEGRLGALEALQILRAEKMYTSNNNNL